MAKIEQLTPAEEALIPTVCDEWLRMGLATGPADRKAAQAAISAVHRLAGFEPPRQWIWLGSPHAGYMANYAVVSVSGDAPMNPCDIIIAQAADYIRRQVSDPVRKQVSDQVRSRVFEPINGFLASEVAEQIEAQFEDPVREYVGDDLLFRTGRGGWSNFAYYDFFRRIERVRGLEGVAPLLRLAAAAGWWWSLDHACIITERPIRLVRDEAHRLHCPDGAALLYPDGWAIYAWHGIRIPAWFVEDKQRITPDTIEAESNAEFRRVMLEIFGFDRYIEARGATLIAEDESLGLPRQLFDLDLNGERVRVLRVVNGTVEVDGRQRQFHIGVALECNTPHEAVAWSYGRPASLYKEALRT